jgi:hypothetical protein
VSRRGSQAVARARDLSLVTDHALIRYIERVHGYDLDPIREMILTPNVLALAKSGSGAVILGCGARIKIEGGRVVTVLAKGMRGK